MPIENAESAIDGFTSPFAAARASGKVKNVHIEADKDGRAALADIFGVVSVESAVADLEVTLWRKEGLRVRGRVSARLTQACIVTLEPMSASVDEEVDMTFLPEGSRQIKRDFSEDGALLVDPDGPDAPEVFTGGEIDLATIAIEAIALGIDPYPRKEGVGFEPPAEEEEAVVEPDDAKESPFAALKDWKPKP
ncbi:YceD family protein [Martelella alba]|uniref:YceD family protein n=1 Tax=Martelella alba TaxID=2590451 RepID=UPI0015E85384|nr:DUF177 domain-containing protein [Martelella alba]